ncbi:MAG: hypothetical protein FWD34_03565 [Oscillospiraceae bacterium]|nr:hypothetical protein [Oscillospiraceae bacterium]
MKKLLALLLGIAMLLSFTACFDDWDDDDYDDYGDNGDDDYSYDEGNADSAESFINKIKSDYSIILQDNGNYLSSSRGRHYMNEIEHALSLFSPAFIKKLVTEVAEFGDDIYLILDVSETGEETGLIEWDDNGLIISLYYERDPEDCGIDVATLAHELGHAVHFIIEEFIGEEQSEIEITAFNGSFSYVGDTYDFDWDEAIHATTFAYDYGMSEYYEDISTIFEYLASKPDEMYTRFIDPNNEPLLLKTQYIREITYMYISSDCFLLFAPLYNAEEYLR